MYIKSRHFSNRTLKQFYWLIPYRVKEIEKKVKEFNYIIEKLKDKISRPYYKASIKASILNELRDKIIKQNSNNLRFYKPNRKEFISFYNLKSVCEGCKKEPIQEEAHIIKRNTEIKGLSNNYLNHYANLWLLCGTCHNIIDGRRDKPKEEREQLLFKNLYHRKYLQKKIYDSLKKERKTLSYINKKLRSYLGFSKEAITIEIRELFKKYKGGL